MNYNSHYLWEKGAEVLHQPVSVVLQQVSVHKKESLFACVCEGECEGEEAVRESGYFTERLVEWFHQIYLEKYAAKAGEAELTEVLQGELVTITKELKECAQKKGQALQLSYWGILIQDNRFWMFYRGSCKGFLINRRFNTGNLRKLEAFGLPEQVMAGKLQRNLGILLLSDEFGNCMLSEELLAVLSSEKKVEDAWMEKRLKELWEKFDKRAKGSGCAGAIYIRTS